MAKTSDILILGGGIIGCTIAYFLRDLGLSVRIVDAGAVIPAASRAAAGMLSPAFEFVNETSGDQRSSTFNQFARHCLDLWPKFAADLESVTGKSIDFQQCGTLAIALTDDERIELTQDYRASVAAGNDSIWYDPDTLNNIAPHVAKNNAGGWHARSDAQVDPRLVLNAVQLALGNHPQIEWNNNRAIMLLSLGAKIIGIRTQTGDEFYAQTTIIANGASLAQLKTEFKCPTIIPIKGEAIAVGFDAPLKIPVIRARQTYLCPKADGRLVIGATQLPGVDDLTVDHQRLDALKASAVAMLPEIANRPELERWSGIRPGTPDDMPYIGTSIDFPDGLIFAVGHYRNGILLAPGTAMIIAQLINGKPPPVWVSAFSPGRIMPKISRSQG